MKKLIATLLLIFWPGVMLSPVQAQRSVFFNMNVRPATSACGRPYSDSFSGSGALNACWTNVTAGLPITPSTLVRSGGKAVPTASGSEGLAVVGGVTYPADQSAQFTTTTFFAPSQGQDTGPCVHMSTVGSGYCWAVGGAQINLWTNGSFGGEIAFGSCPPVTTGDVVKLSIAGTTLTCADITAGTSFSVSDSTFTTGNPGMLISQLDSTNPSVESWISN
jgi:hypothetical protein